ncbi:MAG: TIGR00374 family protein, partial [Chloroflexi bacterium CG_4_10_14_0_8_um_filter_57_5]
MKRWQFWLGVLISAIFLYFVVRKLDWAAFWLSLETANYWWIVPGVAVY